MGENGNENIEGSKECLDKSCNCKNSSARNDDCVEVVKEEQNNNNKEHEVENTDVDEEVVGKNNVGSQSCGVDGVGMRFADMVKNNKLDNKLLHVPTEVSGNEDSIVIFDDEIIELRSQKWSLTDFGQFIGCSMGFNETRMKKVLMSALASSIRKPVIMDEITTKMCVTRVGRIGFARVLVEIDAEKGIKDKIEIMYKSKNISVGTKKIVDVEYYWIPSIYSHYKVFGHTDKFCKKISKCRIDEGSVEKKDNEFKIVQNRKYRRDGYHMYRYSNRQNGKYDKMWNDRRNVRVNTKWQTNNRFEYRRRKEDESKGKGLENNEGINDEANGMKRSNEHASEGSRNFKDKDKECQEGSTDTNNSNKNGMLASNGFTLLNSLVNEEDLVPNTDQRKIVDEFLSKGSDDNNGGMNEWNEDMKRYYRDRKEIFDAAKEIKENEDVIGLCSHFDKQKEMKKLIKEEGLQFCAVLETHVKYKNIKKSYGLFLPYMISDHSPIVVKMPNRVQKRKGSFRFSNFITDKKDFLPTVRSVWNKEFEGHTMYRVVQKMKHLKRKLKQMSWKNGDVFERAEQLRIKVKECQADVDRFPHDENVKEKSWSVLKDCQEAIQDEYSLLCQKPKLEWLKEGDINTAYFHKTIKKMVHRGRIMSIRNEEGVRFENEDVDTQIIKHFEDFLEDSKAPGPDGYTARFYKSAWSIIRKEICQVVKELFLTGKLGEVNTTLVLLVPTPNKFSINVNGKRVGYFKGDKGLRQGDPISPYLFTLVIEVLNLLIQKDIDQSKVFKYHYGCKNLKITHLCFVDDLLVFCHGDPESVKVMKKSLDEISGYSGLLPNLQKGTIFFGGLSSVE
ncbi:RNA-directed DNA polymerase, eukaryota, reverse transcriptase zinc-binding domain protein [Tanacetum coccineum]